MSIPHKVGGGISATANSRGRENQMAKVKDEFVSRTLNAMLLEAMKNLNMVRDALDPGETEVAEELGEITKQISRIEV
jgi:hypothetical protein